MVSAAIGVVVSLGIASVFVFAIQEFTLLVEKNEAETNHLWTTYYTRLFLAQAVEVRPVTGAQPVSVLTVAPNIGMGAVKIDFNARSVAQNASYVPFAVFQREAGTAASVLEATGIFIKTTNPAAVTDNPFDRSYALTFDLGCNNNGLPANCVITPTRNDLYFDRISRFEVQTSAGGCLQVETEGPTIAPACVGANTVYGTSDKLKTITLYISTRYFKGTNRSRWYYHTGNVWLGGTPAGAGGGVLVAPANPAQFRDITSTLKVTLRDNVLSTTSLTTGTTSREERAHGGIYYFMPIIPRPTN